MKKYLLILILYSMVAGLSLAPAWAAKPTVDPTRPVHATSVIEAKSATGPYLPQLTLQGIHFDNGPASRAYINGKSYKVGQHIADWSIVAIEEERVLVRGNNQIHTLVVFQRSNVQITYTK